jgi:hypothetical protein
MSSLEEARTKYINARAIYDKFIDDHSRPMTEGEESESGLAGISSPLGEIKKSMVTLTLEEKEECDRLRSVVDETYVSFMDEHNKLNR